MTILDADRSDIWFNFVDESERDVCSHQGECYNDCADTVDEYSFEFEKIPRENAISALKVTGGWDREELEGMSDRELYIRILWVAAGNAQDENSLEGHVSIY